MPLEQPTVIFGLQVVQIPLINLRNEFANNYNLLQDPAFRDKFRQWKEPIATPYLTWYGLPETLLTFLMLRTVIGIEAYLPAAVSMELAIKGTRTDKHLQAIEDPFTLGKGTAENYYNLLPALLDPKLSLRSHSPELWKSTVRFYAQVRNSIFHGDQLSADCVDGVREAFQHFRLLYHWIDGWHSFHDSMNRLKAAVRRVRNANR